jgi:cytochrome c-type biogenesis protein CcmH
MSLRRSLSLLTLALVAAAMLFGASVRAQGTPASGNTPQTSGVSRLEDTARAVSSALRCPVCQGESIQDSPADLAKQMRQVVREQLAAGRSSEEVKAYFVSKYGEWILLTPKARGVNLTVYVLPFALLLGGAVLILVMARKWSHPRVNTIPDSPAPD